MCDQKIAAWFDSDYEDDAEKSALLCYKYLYCIVSAPESVENKYALNGVTACGGMVVKFKKCESMSARLWFYSWVNYVRYWFIPWWSGFLLRVQTGDELITLPLALKDIDEQLHYAIMLRNGEEIFSSGKCWMMSMYSMVFWDFFHVAHYRLYSSLKIGVYSMRSIRVKSNLICVVKLSYWRLWIWVILMWNVLWGIMVITLFCIRCSIRRILDW